MDWSALAGKSLDNAGLDAVATKMAANVEREAIGTTKGARLDRPPASCCPASRAVRCVAVAWKP